MTTIKQYRERLGLSQSQLAARINTPIKTLQGWEGGRKPPPCLFVLLDILDRYRGIK